MDSRILAILLALLLNLSAAVTYETLQNYPILSDQISNGTNPGPRNATAANEETFLLGVGKGDITGPVAGVAFMGYAEPDQIGNGLRQRLYSRAFIIGSPSRPSDRFVYLVLDIQSGDTAIRDGILEGLRSMGPEFAMYTKSNVAITGTHSHSGPGGWNNYFIHQVTSYGFDRLSYQAIVTGTLRSIMRAHQSLQKGQLSVGATEIQDANINRSLWAYLANPEKERSRYKNDVDKHMTLIRFTRADGVDMGVLTFFATHGTSMYNNNTLVTGDNKGVAAWMFERAMMPSVPGFVAGFSQSNVGDVSPNIGGAYCEGGSDNGKKCNFEDSTCKGASQRCHARGPFYGFNDAGARSCYEIGRRQFNGAFDLYQKMLNSSDPTVWTTVKGSLVRSFHRYQNLANFKFQLPDGRSVSTCSAALGYSFAAGTSDGPGQFDFKQGGVGVPNASPLWELVSSFIKTPTAKQRSCHGVKPILLDVGEIDTPYAWAPNVVDIQILRVGQIVILISPGEATTMSGRRWREAIYSRIVRSNLLSDNINSANAPDPIILLGGPANTYSHYITTPQEYSRQRYEGASTLHGPNTLDAYIDLTSRYLPLLGNRPFTMLVTIETKPKINTNISLSFTFAPPIDHPHRQKLFGDVLSSPGGQYKVGNAIMVAFVGANPRNNLRLEGSYARVQMLVRGTSSSPSRNNAHLAFSEDEIFTNGTYSGHEEVAPNDEWRTILDDFDFNLTFQWFKPTKSNPGSTTVIAWETLPGTIPGTYRIVYDGDAKISATKTQSFQGKSPSFQIVA